MLLLGVELLTAVIVLVFEFSNDSHTSKVVLIFDAAYTEFFIILNLLQFLKYGYLE